MLTQYIVAIAGSAGCLEPLKMIFDHTPLDNASYVILRHLPRNYQSTLNLILKKHTDLKVDEVKQGESIIKNRVYYAPHNGFLIISDGTFQVIKRTAVSNRSIDIFLESLARDENKRKVVAVILSGTGNDGVKGIAAIKEAGGLVIVQSPDTCEHPELPSKIIKAGYADFVLLPEDMPPVIHGYMHRSLTNNAIGQ